MVGDVRTNDDWRLDISVATLSEHRDPDHFTTVFLKFKCDI